MRDGHGITWWRRLLQKVPVREELDSKKRGKKGFGYDPFLFFKIWERRWQNFPSKKKIKNKSSRKALRKLKKIIKTLNEG